MKLSTCTYIKKTINSVKTLIPVHFTQEPEPKKSGGTEESENTGICYDQYFGPNKNGIWIQIRNFGPILIQGYVINFEK